MELEGSGLSMGCLEQDTRLTRMHETTEVKGGTDSDRRLPLKALWAQRYGEDPLRKGSLKGDREWHLKDKMVLALQRIPRQEIAGGVKCRCVWGGDDG